MNLAILGYGTVGRNVHKLLKEVDGITVKYILELPDRLTEDCMVSEPSIILQDPEIELVVDALPGIHPSSEYIKEALSSGKSVVSSNKAAICSSFKELNELAKEHGVRLLYEASCGGGIPVIEELMRVGKLDEIDSISGILNGTTNYILYMMQKEGMSYGDALKEAQRLGYAEADPTADVSGFDVRNKILILSSLAYNGYLTDDIPMIGIESITKEDMDRFASEEKTIKLMGISKREGSSYALAVVPVLLPKDSMEANVPLNFNIVSFTGNYVGELKFYGQGAGGDPTADAVVRDVENVLYGDSMAFYRSFENELQYKPELLSGRCHVGGELLTDTVVAEAAAKAKAEGKSFYFEL